MKYRILKAKLCIYVCVKRDTEKNITSQYKEHELKVERLLFQMLSFANKSFISRRTMEYSICSYNILWN